MIKIKRIYDEATADDGFRILVDRLWPRGVSKEQAKVDLWLKEVAPSPELRIWFGHDPVKWQQFKQEYFSELDHNPAVGQLKTLSKEHPVVTLLYAAKDTKHNHAIVLEELLKA